MVGPSGRRPRRPRGPADRRRGGQAFAGAVPNAVQFEEHVFDLSFHPTRNIVAAGLITGELFVYVRVRGAEVRATLAQWALHARHPAAWSTTPPATTC